MAALDSHFMPPTSLAPFLFEQEVSRLTMRNDDDDPRDIVNNIRGLGTQYRQPVNAAVILSILMRESTNLPNVYISPLTDRMHDMGRPLTDAEIEDLLTNTSQSLRRRRPTTTPTISSCMRTINPTVSLRRASTVPCTSSVPTECPPTRLSTANSSKLPRPRPQPR